MAHLVRLKTPVGSLLQASASAHAHALPLPLAGLQQQQQHRQKHTLQANATPVNRSNNGVSAASMRPSAPVRSFSTGGVRPLLYRPAGEPSPAAAASSSSDSSDPSSSSASSTPRLLLIAAIAAGSVFLSSAMLGKRPMTSAAPVRAEGAVVLGGGVGEAELPTLNLAGADEFGAADSGASSGSGRKAGGAGVQKKKKKKARVSARAPLANPGKWSNLHREASSLMQVQVVPGLRVQAAVAAFPHMEHAAKQFILQPVLELGTQNGSGAQIILATHLGNNHKMDAQWDVMGGGVGGSYKYSASRGLSIKPAFTMGPHGAQIMLDVDWKRKESSAAFTVVNLQDLSLSFCQAVTPELAVGVELHHGLSQFTHLNGGFRYTRGAKEGQNKEQYVFSKRESKYTATYYRELSVSQHPQEVLGLHAPGSLPPLRSEMGVEATYLANGTHKSDVGVGIRHSRAFYTYHAVLTASPTIMLDFQADALPTPMAARWGLNCVLPLDGQNEPQFGISFFTQA